MLSFRYEGFGNVAAEAMPTLISDERKGSLVPVEDVTAMSDALPATPRCAAGVRRLDAERVMRSWDELIAEAVESCKSRD